MVGQGECEFNDDADHEISECKHRDEKKAGGDGWCPYIEHLLRSNQHTSKSYVLVSVLEAKISAGFLLGCYLIEEIC